MKIKIFKIKNKPKIPKSCKISKDCDFEGENFFDEDCQILHSKITSCKISKGVKILSSTLSDSVVDEKTNIGPYAHLRQNNVIEKNCKIGNFVEIKQSTIGDGTKISHLAYVGNAKIGKNCNIGCGVIFANYDGKLKHQTEIGDNCFVGSNCTLIAPCTY